MSTMLLPSFPSQLTSEIVGTTKVCPEIAFTNHKGKRKSGLEKKSKKLLLGLQEPLGRFLEADETVLMIFRAQSHVNGLQQYTMGIMVYWLTATVVVVTNKRFIQLRTTGSNKWDQGVRICKWENVAEAQVKGFLGKALNLHFPDGKKHRVWKLDGTQAKVLKKLLPELIQANTQGAARPGGSVASACPECKATLTSGNYECPQCRLLFKNEKKMRWLALLPGAAYFYCGKLLLGVLDTLGEGLFVLALTLSVIAIVLGESALTEDTVVGLVIFVFLIGVEIAITIHHCGHFVRDFIPTKDHAQGLQASAASIGSST